MQNVRVSPVSSAGCSAAEASSFLHQFLSDEPNTNSFARSYLEVVVQVLDDRLRAGRCGTSGRTDAELSVPSDQWGRILSSHPAIPSEARPFEQSLAAQGFDGGKRPLAKGKKRKAPYIENGVLNTLSVVKDICSEARLSDKEDEQYHGKKKKRKHNKTPEYAHLAEEVAFPSTTMKQVRPIFDVGSGEEDGDTKLEKKKKRKSGAYARES